MLHGLAENVALLIGLVAAYSAIARFRLRRRRLGMLLMGLALGSIAAAGMFAPVRFAPGIFYDGRSIVLGLAGLFGGVWVAGAAALVAGGVRIAFGGVGVCAGVATVLGCSAVGVLFRRLVRAPLHRWRIGWLYLFGVAVHLPMLAAQLLVPPWPSGLALLGRVWLPVMVVFPAATVVMALLLGEVHRRQEAADALAASERRFRMAYDLSPDAINLNRLSDGLYVDVNEGFTAITGYTREDVIGKTSLELGIWVRPEDRERLRAGLERDGVVRNLEAPFRTKDGRVVTGLMSARIIELDGEPHILSYTRDMEDLRQAERRIAQSEALLRKTQTMARVGSWSQDLRTGEWSYSDELCVLYGFSEEAPPESWEDLLAQVPEGERDAARRAFEEGIAAGASEVTREHRIQRRDTGEMRTVFSKAEVVRGADGTPTRLVGFVQDVTERAAAEAELRELTRTLEVRVHARTAALARSNEALSAFAHSVSHDLRAPLRAIRGFAEILAGAERDRLSPEGSQHLDYILEATERMERLIDALLDYARLGERGTGPQAVSLEQVAEQALADLGPQVAEAGATVHVERPLPPVMGQPELVRQILGNLLENALKFRAADRPSRVHLRAVQEEGWVTIEVADNGIGVPEAMREKVFGLFQRLHPEARYPGTGVGLASVRRAAEMMGGAVSCHESAEGGAAFRVRLCAARASGQEPNAAASSSCSQPADVPIEESGGE